MKGARPDGEEVRTADIHAQQLVFDSVVFDGYGDAVDETFPDYASAHGATYHLAVTRGATRTTMDIVVGDECARIAANDHIGFLIAETNTLAFDEMLAYDQRYSAIACRGTSGTADNSID